MMYVKYPQRNATRAFSKSWVAGRRILAGDYKFGIALTRFVIPLASKSLPKLESTVVESIFPLLVVGLNMSDTEASLATVVLDNGMTK